MNEALLALAAKLISLPLAAKGAVGATAAAAAIGTAGATGVMPVSADVHGQPAVEQSAVREDAAERGGARGRSEQGPDRPAKASFGQSTAADARDGGVDGSQIAARGQARAADRRPVDVGGPERAQDAARPGRAPAGEDGPARPHGGGSGSGAGSTSADERGGNARSTAPAAGEDAGRDGRPTKDRTPAAGRP